MGESLIPSNLSLPPEAIDELFPFFFEVGADFRLLRLGRSLHKTCPKLSAGDSFDECFAPSRPVAAFELEKLRNTRETLYVIEDRTTGLNLRGQIIGLKHGGFIFLGSPRLSGTSDLRTRNLGVEDFAIHDPAVDLLHFLRSQKTATADLLELTEKLKGQRAELKETNLKLVEQEAETRRSALIAESTEDAVVLCDPSGRIEWVNAGFTRLTGYESDECIGMIPGHLLQGPGTDLNTVAYMRERLAARQRFHVEILNYHKSGQRYWLSFEVQPIFDDKGEVIHFMAIEKDTTAERAAKANLRAQFKVSQLLASDRTLEILAEDLIQTLRSELDWDCAVLWLQEADSDQLTCAHMVDVGNAKKQGESSPNPSVLNRKFAEEIWHKNSAEWSENISTTSTEWVSAVATPIRLGDSCMGVIELRSRQTESHDENRLQALTAIGSELAQFIERNRSHDKLRQRSEELAQLNEELAAASEAKDEFLASISHEIRTPLNGVIGATDALEDTHLNEEQREAVETIGASAGHLHSLLSDVLDHSRIEAGKLELLPEPTVLQKLFDGTVRIFKPIAAQKSLVFPVKISVPSNLAISIDGTRLQQVLVNLLGNAFKFTSRGGVSLFVEHRLSGKQIELDITVSDTGIGIPADRADQLFEPFEQLDASRTRTFGGTGLGLAISRQLVELMAGSLELERSSENGSVFKVRISAPIVDAPKSAALNEFTFTPTDPILVVDDHPANASVMKILLGRLGLEMHHCFSAVEAMSYCAKLRPPIILMDLHMPDIDGIQATKMLREEIFDKSAPLIPIVALTADARSEVRKSCLEAGMDEFFTKPVRLSDLSTLLEQFLPTEVKSTASAIADTKAPPTSTVALDIAITDGLFGIKATTKRQKEMNKMFNDMWRDIIPALQAIADLQDSRETTEGQKKCHELKGVVVNFGFNAAAGILGEMEYDASAFANSGNLTRTQNALTEGRAALLARYHFLTPEEP